MKHAMIFTFQFIENLLDTVFAVSCAAIMSTQKQINKQKKTIHSIDDLTKGSQKIVQSETVEVALRGLAKAIDEIEDKITAVLVANNLRSID